MKNRTNFSAKLRGIALSLAICLGTGNLSAQTGSDDITKFYDTQRGYTNPASPEAWAMIKYGDAELNLYTGALGLSIPVYTFKNKNFTIPISLNYASTGYKPNLQTGVLGAGWYLNAGGVITREVNGIPDESVEAYTYKDKYAGSLLVPPDKRTHTMSGYYQLYSNPNLQNFCKKETLYSGVRGQEYTIAYLDELVDRYYELEPDLFHYNFMGYTGSFMLQPGKIVVFDCNTPPGEIRVETWGSGEYDGLKGFSITTGDGYVYTFSPRDDSSNFGYDSSDEGQPLISSWSLDDITSQDGDRVTFEYDSSQKAQMTYSCIPTLYFEDEYKRTKNYGMDTEGGDDDDPNPTPTNMKEISVNATTAHPLVRITVSGEAEIEFIYGDKASEIWDSDIISQYAYNDSAAEQTRRLNRITVKNLFTGKIIKTCTLGYNYDRDDSTPVKKRLTLLTSAELSGEGTYSMEYHDQNRDCPPINTFAIDWWGYSNGMTVNDHKSSVEGSSFYPAHKNGDIAITYNARNANEETAKYGMITKLTYPTGGYSIFNYEGNDYGRKVVRDDAHSYVPMLRDASGLTGGVRVSSILEFASGDLSDGIYRDFTYETAPGVSSGILLWEPHVYMHYKLKTTGYNIVRKYTTTQQSFPYSKSNHIEYERVLEKRYSTSDPTNVATVEHCFYTSKEYPDQFNPDDYRWEWGNFLVEYGNIPDMNNLRFLYCQVFSRSNLRGKPRSKTYMDNSIPVYTETYAYTDKPDPLAGYIQVPTSFLCQISRQRINTASSFPLITRRTYQTGSAVKLSTYETNHYNDLGQLSRVEQGDSKGNTRVTHTVRSGDVRLGTEKAEWTDWYGPPAYPLKQTVCLEKPDSTRIVLSSVRCAYTTVTGVDETAVTCLESLSRGKVMPGIYPDSIVYRTELHNDRFDAWGNVLQSTDKGGLKSCYVWGYNGAWVVARIDNASLEQVTPLLSTDITLGPLPGGLSAAEKNALQAIAGAQATTYDYQPLAGIREIRDLSGRTETFEYDEHDRLFRTRDDKNKPLGEYRYHIITAQ